MSVNKRWTTLVAVALVATVGVGCGTQYDRQRSVTRNSDLRALVLEQQRGIEELRREQESLRAAVEEIQHGASGNRATYSAAAVPSTDPRSYRLDPLYVPEPDPLVPDPLAPVPTTVDPSSVHVSAATLPAQAPSYGGFEGVVGDVPSPQVAVPTEAIPPSVQPAIPSAVPAVAAPAAPTELASAVAPSALAPRGEVPNVPESLAGTAYSTGVRSLADSRHDEAIQSFRDFIHGNQSSPYADDAQYWIGDAYFRKGQYHRAIIEFNQVAISYGSGDRAPPALIRQAEAFNRVGDRVDARLNLQKVINRYPGTESATKAATMLGEIGG